MSARADDEKQDGCFFLFVGFGFFGFVVYSLLSAFLVFPEGWNLIDVFGTIGKFIGRHHVVFLVGFIVMLVWGTIVLFRAGAITLAQLLSLIFFELVIPLAIQLFVPTLFG